MTINVVQAESPAALVTGFREVMSRVVTPVAVATTLGPDGPYGTTVSAFASLSMSPPMVMVALDEQSVLLSLIRTTRQFGLNVLVAGQSALALRFAKRGVDGFDGLQVDVETGVPLLANVAGWISCDDAEFVQGGDHQIVLGKVRHARHLDEARPLSYHHRTFGSHYPDEQASPTQESPSPSRRRCGRWFGNGPPAASCIASHNEGRADRTAPASSQH